MRNTLYGNIKQASILLSSMGFARVPYSRDIYKILEQYFVPRRPVYLKSIDSYMYLSPNDGSMGEALLLKGMVEPYTCNLMARTVKIGMTCVDVGANIGYMSLVMAKRLKNTGSLYCFEPDPYTFKQLEQNIGLNNIKNATLSPCAVSDHTGKQTLYVDRAGRYLNSLYDKVGDQQITADLTSIDSYFKDVNIDVLKIDAQGADGLIVKGGLNVLREHPPELFLEFWPKGFELAGTMPREILETLRGIGYTLYIVDDDHEKTWRASDKEILSESLTMNCDNPFYGYANLYCTITDEG